MAEKKENTGKTRGQLLKMGFMPLRKHAESLQIDTRFGSTKAALIKLILDKDPPSDEAAAAEDAAGQADSYSTIADTVAVAGAKKKKKKAVSKKRKKRVAVAAVSGKGSKMKKKIIKTIRANCPTTGPMAMSRYLSILNLFGHFDDLNTIEFGRAIIECDDSVIDPAHLQLIANAFSTISPQEWDHLVNPLYTDKMNIATFINDVETHFKAKDAAGGAAGGGGGGGDSAKIDAPFGKEMLLIKTLTIPDIRIRLHEFNEAVFVKTELLELRAFIDTLDQGFAEVLANETYQKILIASLLMCKFRNLDKRLYGYHGGPMGSNHKGRFKDVNHFLSQVIVSPSSDELFRAKKFDKLRESGALLGEIMKPVTVFEPMDMEKIRKKAIKFGAKDVPMANALKKDDKTAEERVKEEIGVPINTSSARANLAAALARRQAPAPVPAPVPAPLPASAPAASEEKKSDEARPADDDLAKYRRMLKMGVGLEGILQKMEMSGVPEAVRAQFEADERQVVERKEKQQKKEKEKEAVAEGADRMAEIKKRGPKFAIPTGGAPALRQTGVPTTNAEIRQFELVDRERRGPEGSMAVALAAAVARRQARAPAPAIVPAPLPPGVRVGGCVDLPVPGGIQSGSRRKPKMHENSGITWQRATERFMVVQARAHVTRQNIERRVRDIQARYALYDRVYGQSDDTKDAAEMPDVDDADGEGEEKETMSADNKTYCERYPRKDDAVSWQGLLGKYKLIQDTLLRGYEMKSRLNEKRVRKLIEIYHAKWRPKVFKSINEPRYVALVGCVNAWDCWSTDTYAYVPDDVFGVVWMFVKPFDELIELKFAIDCVKEFWDAKHEALNVKKLPIMSARGADFVAANQI